MIVHLLDEEYPKRTGFIIWRLRAWVACTLAWDYWHSPCSIPMIMGVLDGYTHFSSFPVPLPLFLSQSFSDNLTRNQISLLEPHMSRGHHDPVRFQSDGFSKTAATLHSANNGERSTSCSFSRRFSPGGTVRMCDHFHSKKSTGKVGPKLGRGVDCCRSVFQTLWGNLTSYHIDSWHFG